MKGEGPQAAQPREVALSDAALLWLGARRVGVRWRRSSGGAKFEPCSRTVLSRPGSGNIREWLLIRTGAFCLIESNIGFGHPSAAELNMEYLLPETFGHGQR